MTSGLVFNIHRLSTDDGPGLRDTFFLKGCGLRCVWCHNPESISAKRAIWWLERKCIGARDCLAVCPHHALVAGPSGIVIDRHACDACGLCADACPAKAMEIIGNEWTADALVREALKDRIFFNNSGGGVTFSGGEPTLQADFVAEVFQRLRAEGIHTALDTCGQLLGSAGPLILQHTDLVLYDLKEIDSASHREWTGVSNEAILRNLLAVRDFVRDDGTRPDIWIRTPLIPHFTATERNLSGIGTFLREHLGNRVLQWDLCAFNPSCTEKYHRLGIHWPLANEPFLNRDLGEKLLQTAQHSLAHPDRVRLTGLI